MPTIDKTQRHTHLIDDELGDDLERLPLYLFDAEVSLDDLSHGDGIKAIQSNQQHIEVKHLYTARDVHRMSRKRSRKPRF